MRDARLALLQSEAFKEILSELRSMHPVKLLLPAMSTAEHRMIHQIRCEEYEKIMTSFEILGRDNAITAIESTYGTDELNNKK